MILGLDDKLVMNLLHNSVERLLISKSSFFPETFLRLEYLTINSFSDICCRIFGCQVVQFTFDNLCTGLNGWALLLIEFFFVPSRTVDVIFAGFSQRGPKWSPTAVGSSSVRALFPGLGRGSYLPHQLVLVTYWQHPEKQLRLLPFQLLSVY